MTDSIYTDLEGLWSDFVTYGTDIVRPKGRGWEAIHCGAFELRRIPHTPGLPEYVVVPLVGHNFYTIRPIENQSQTALVVGCYVNQRHPDFLQVQALWDWPGKEPTMTKGEYVTHVAQGELLRNPICFMVRPVRTEPDMWAVHRYLGLLERSDQRAFSAFVAATREMLATTA